MIFIETKNIGTYSELIFNFVFTQKTQIGIHTNAYIIICVVALS